MMRFPVRNKPTSAPLLAKYLASGEKFRRDYVGEFSQSWRSASRRLERTQQQSIKVRALRGDDEKRMTDKNQSRWRS
jgi:hypothetical protein